ncbi:Regulatory GAL4 [Hyphodiscus hymeniophilus]|uniref:Regulatory GAL4 n=1 Tax=Hyphodiscus hymeniophilus TaxID=353542 RepID=A0A9P7AW95_9HELO|nr:Regulatory GAL4 [Hyphodiscus hymeniophilus]
MRSLFMQPGTVEASQKFGDDTVDIHANNVNTANVNSSQSLRSNRFSLETPPSSGHFDWDERNGVPSGNKFVDGMATLTGDFNGGGYLGIVFPNLLFKSALKLTCQLGVASGAALLRLTGGADQNPLKDTDRRPTIPYAITSLSCLEGFIDAYFALFHRSYPIVHEATFKAQFMEVIPRPSGNAWQVLLYAICATGAFSAATQQSDVDLMLFEAAKARLLIDMLETGNLVLVQALALMANYVQKRDKPNSGYNYIGLARRIAMGLGLHKEFPNWDASLLTLEIRRRVWWSLYVFDVGATITVSRPMDFPEGGIETKLPLNVHDTEITGATRTKPPPTLETTLYSHLQAQSEFHLATCQIYSQIISTPYPTAAELIEHDDNRIAKWLTALPAYFQENAVQSPRYSLCHAILRWRYRNFRLLMYRPFVIRRYISRSTDGVQKDSTTEFQSVEIAIQRCLDSAQESVSLISEFWSNNQRTMMASWYGLYFLFQAILIPIICLRNDPQSEKANDWREQILESIRIIASMLQLNPTAERCLNVVRSLSEEYLSVDEGLGGPTEESPQTQLNSLYPMIWPTLESVQFEGVDAMLQESTIMDFMNQMPEFI